MDTRAGDTWTIWAPSGLQLVAHVGDRWTIPTDSTRWSSSTTAADQRRWRRVVQLSRALSTRCPCVFAVVHLQSIPTATSGVNAAMNSNSPSIKGTCSGCRDAQANSCVMVSSPRRIAAIRCSTVISQSGARRLPLALEASLGVRPVVGVLGQVGLARPVAVLARVGAFAGGVGACGCGCLAHWGCSSSGVGLASRPR